MNLPRLRSHLLVKDRDLSVQCAACGDRLKIALPVNMDVWLAAATKFGEVHAGCADLADGSRQAVVFKP